MLPVTNLFLISAVIFLVILVLVLFLVLFLVLVLGRMGVVVVVVLSELELLVRKVPAVRQLSISKIFPLFFSF